MGIENVSDTARWVAVYRAMESERPDALFHDPFARRLAGERGQAIVDGMPKGRRMAWPMIVRTAVFDEMILERVRGGVVQVVNLAAGLDARPWRLPLPPELRWIDVDLPGILAQKAHELRGEEPRCEYRAEVADLRDADARRALLRRLGMDGTDTLVVSEGLLVYLGEGPVGELARDLHAAGAHWWLTDLASPRLLVMMNRMWGPSVEAGSAPFLFAPEEGTDFFVACGWREAAFRSTWDEAHRLKRGMRGMALWRLLGRLGGERRREEARRFSGQVLLERA